MRNSASIQVAASLVKKILFNRGKAVVTLAILFAVVSTASTWAQGTVLFQNDERGLVYQWGTESDPTPVLVGFDNQPHIQIAYAPAGTSLTPWRYIPGGDNSTEHWLSLNPGWTLGPTANLVAPPGRFDGGVTSLEGIPPGTQADYVTFGWGPGASFDEQAQFGKWYGYAGPFTTLTGGGGLPTVSLADSFTGITIIGSATVIPEPSSAALLAFGFWTVLALKNKKGSNHRTQRSPR